MVNKRAIHQLLTAALLRIVEGPGLWQTQKLELGEVSRLLQIVRELTNDPSVSTNSKRYRV